MFHFSTVKGELTRKATLMISIKISRGICLQSGGKSYGMIPYISLLRDMILWGARLQINSSR
jgi:hypothetical protein